MHRAFRGVGQGGQTTGQFIGDETHSGGIGLMGVDDGVDIRTMVEDVQKGFRIDGDPTGAFHDAAVQVQHDDIVVDHGFIDHAGRGDQDVVVVADTDITAGERNQLMSIHEDAGLDDVAF